MEPHDPDQFISKWSIQIIYFFLVCSNNRIITVCLCSHTHQIDLALTCTYLCVYVYGSIGIIWLWISVNSCSDLVNVPVSAAYSPRSRVWSRITELKMAHDWRGTECVWSQVFRENGCVLGWHYCTDLLPSTERRIEIDTEKKEAEYKTSVFLFTRVFVRVSPTPLISFRHTPVWFPCVGIAKSMYLLPTGESVCV